MNVDKMPAGREMDVEIAWRVMGLPRAHCFGTSDGVPRYSTDIAAAWGVAEKIAGGHRFALVKWNLGGNPDIDGWLCRTGVESPRGTDSIADTAPLAICRAALKGVL